MNLQYDMKKGELYFKANKYIQKLEGKLHVTTTKRALTPLYTPPLEDPSREPIVTKFTIKVVWGHMYTRSTLSHKTTTLTMRLC